MAVGDSFFQEQQDGDFSVSLVSISAVGGKKHHGKNVLGVDRAGNTCPLPTTESQKKREQRYFDAYDAEVDGVGMVDEKTMRRTYTRVNGGGWLEWLCGLWYD